MIRQVVMLSISAMLCFASKTPAEDHQVIKIGIIGLDTSHVPSFTKAFNQEPADPRMQNCRVVAAYPHGSRDIESSFSRIPKYTEAVRELGVEVVESIDDLLDRVDCVLLETNDGKPHLDQALKVFRSGKRVFIDKPVSSDLTGVLAIFQASDYFEVQMFSSSSLRYTDGAQLVHNGELGRVYGCDTYSPCKFEPSHTDLFWYGIHGVEPLYACMGSGCDSVRLESTEAAEVAIGKWSDGRIGIFRGIRLGKSGYGGTAFCEKGIQSIGPYQGYQPLVVQIANFFRTGIVPIEPEETIELYAFMQAAHESKRKGGTAVAISDVMNRATQAAEKLLREKIGENFKNNP